MDTEKDILEETGLDKDYSNPEQLLELEDEDGQITPSSIKKLREQLSLSRAEAKENLDRWQRARADLVNFKKDSAILSVEQESRQKTRCAEAIIPALDAFEMAFAEQSFASTDENWQNGIKSLYNNLLKSIEKFGVTRMHPQGEIFDPYQHEALREVSIADRALDNTVESVVRSGYRIDNTLIRPAQVVVHIYAQSSH